MLSHHGDPIRHWSSRTSLFAQLQHVQALGIEQIVTSYKSPWQNPYVERLIVTVRWECLDHMIVLSEDHLRRILRDYVEYYNESRTHLAWEVTAQCRVGWSP